MKVIGLTGGIGCGKTTVAGILEKHFSMKVIYTDEIAKEQMSKGGISYQPIVDEFGSEILQPDGEIDRQKLSEIIFGDGDRSCDGKALQLPGDDAKASQLQSNDTEVSRLKRKRINELTHPNVKTYILDTIEVLKELGTFKAVFIETALLIEAGYSEICDEVWYVYASEDERKERLKKFRGMKDQKIDYIFSGQHTDEEYRKHADRIINNGDDVTVSGIFEQISSFIE